MGVLSRVHCFSSPSFTDGYYESVNMDLSIGNFMSGRIWAVTYHEAFVFQSFPCDEAASHHAKAQTHPDVSCFNNCFFNCSALDYLLSDTLIQMIASYQTTCETNMCFQRIHLYFFYLYIFFSLLGANSCHLGLLKFEGIITPFLI
jgi:hypothetical protein